MGNTFFWQWEVELIEFMQAHGNAFWDGFFKFFAFFGSEIIIVPLLAAIYWCFNKELGKRLMIVGGSVNCIYPMIKNICCRNRPYIAHDTIECKDPVDKDYDIYDQSKQGYSFPSGHSANSMVVYANIGRYLDNKIVKIILFTLTICVGLSRFYLGVHYPTDVIVGYLIGLATMLTIDYILLKYKEKYVYIALLLICAIGMFFARSSDYYAGYGLLLGVILAIKFEEKYVNFKMNNNAGENIIRFVVGLIIFVVLRALLKMPFSAEFLDSNTYPAYLYRTIRYAILMLVEIGLYPLTFKYLHKFFKGKKEK